MAQLAIEGHKTRGKEVIEILEMLGGKTSYECRYKDGFDTHYAYFIDTNENDFIDGLLLIGDERITKLSIFTLEEFLEKFPYKVGNKVTHSDYESPLEIVGMKWEDDSIKYEVYTNDYEYWFFNVDELQPYKEETTKDNLVTEEDFNNTPEVEQEYMELAENLLNQLIEGTHWKCNEFDSQKMLAMFLKKNTPGVAKKDNSIIFDIPKGYEFTGIDDDNQQVVFTKIQPQYPKTFIDVLNFWHPDRQFEDDYQRCYKKDLIEKFQDLLYARDAYWTIYSEENGLGKPWEPDWDNLSTNHEFIKISKGSFTYSSRVLVFPTTEMRDAFYENFKELIEQCSKELL